MAKVFVFCEFSGDNLKKGSLELLTAVKKAGQDLVTGALGPGSDQLQKVLGFYGSSTHYCNTSEDLGNYNSETYCHLVTQMIKESGASVVLSSSSLLGRDLFPRVAARLDTGVISDCTELNLDGENIQVRRPLYSGKCSAAVEFKNSPFPIVLMRPNQLPVETPTESSDRAPELRPLEKSETPLRTLIKEVVQGTSEKLDLTEANIIVSGGRGMGGPENFKVLEELAAALGATVGASRAVVDAGWVPHNMQVGQTGKTVAPTLYIACGISGAIQHLAGMSGSKVIVAINKDPEAPIFQKATYGVVGDVFEVVPKLTEEFKKILA